MQAGDPLDWHFDAKIATRHHEAVAGGDDRVEVVDGRGLLNLDDDGRLVADDPARFEHVFVPLHERQRDPVGADGEGAVEVGVIFLGQGADGEERIGKADALARGQCAAGDDLGDDAVRLNTAH